MLALQYVNETFGAHAKPDGIRMNGISSTYPSASANLRCSLHERFLFWKLRRAYNGHRCKSYTKRRYRRGATWMVSFWERRLTYRRKLGFSSCVWWRDSSRTIQIEDERTLIWVFMSPLQNLECMSMIYVVDTKIYFTKSIFLFIKGMQSKRLWRSF